MGSSSQPPIMVWLASSAIPVSVTHEFQDVISWAVTPLTVVWAPVVTLHPTLLDFSWDVLGGPLGLVLQRLLPPPCLRLWCLCQLLYRLLCGLHLFLPINSHQPQSSLEVIMSRPEIWFSHGSIAQVSPLVTWMLILLQTLLTFLQVSTGRDSFWWWYRMALSSSSLIIQEIHAMDTDLKCSLFLRQISVPTLFYFIHHIPFSIPPILQVMLLFLRALHHCYKAIIELFLCQNRKTSL